MPWVWNEAYVSAMDYAIRKAYSDIGLFERRALETNDVNKARVNLLPYIAERVAALAFTDLFLTAQGDNYLGRRVLARTREMNNHIGKERALQILAEVLGITYSYDLGQVETDSNGKPSRDPVSGTSTFAVDHAVRYNAIQFDIAPLADRELSDSFVSYAREAFRRYLPHWLFVMPFRLIHHINADIVVTTALATRTRINANVFD